MAPKAFWVEKIICLLGFTKHCGVSCKISGWFTLNVNDGKFVQSPSKVFLFWNGPLLSRCFLSIFPLPDGCMK